MFIYLNFELLFKRKLNIQFLSQVVTFPVLLSNLWLVAMVGPYR